MTAALKVTGPAIVIRAGRFGFGYRIAVQLPDPPKRARNLREARAMGKAYVQQLGKLPVVEEDVHGKDGNNRVDVSKGRGRPPRSPLPAPPQTTPEAIQGTPESMMKQFEDWIAYRPRRRG